jgi:O-antigen/teichoic acid export membrane protein
MRLTLFVEQLEKRTGLNLRYFAVSGFWVTIRYILLGLLSLATSVAFARLATQEIYGQYQFVFSIISLLSLLSLPGLNTISLRGVSKGLLGTVLTTTKLSFRASWLVALGACLTGLFFLVVKDEPTTGWSLIGVSVFLPFLYGTNTWYTYYEGQMDFRSPTIRIPSMIALGALWLVIGIWQQWSLSALIIGYFGISAVITSLYYLEVVRNLQQTQSNKTTDAVSPRLGIAYTLQKFSSSIPDTVQTLLVASLYDYSSLGVISIGYILINSASGLIGALSSTYFPLLMKYKQLPHGRIILQNLVIGVVLVAVYYIFVRIAFVPIYGGQLQNSFYLALSLSGALIFLPLRLYFASYLTAHHAPSALTMANIVSYLLAASVFLTLRTWAPTNAFTAYFYVLQGSTVLILGFLYWQRTKQSY